MRETFLTICDRRTRKRKRRRRKKKNTCLPVNQHAKRSKEDTLNKKCSHKISKFRLNFVSHTICLAFYDFIQFLMDFTVSFIRFAFGIDFEYSTWFKRWQRWTMNIRAWHNVIFIHRDHLDLFCHCLPSLHISLRCVRKSVTFCDSI